MPDDVIHNDTGRAYNYPWPLRTIAHIWETHAYNILMNSLQRKLQTALNFSTLYTSLIPVHLQKQRAEILLEKLPFLERLIHWYQREGIVMPREYTTCPCHVH